MKKVLILMTIFILTFSTNAFAIDYKTITVTATFAEEIDFADIEKVELIIFGEGIDYVDDAASVLNIIELTQENNYTQSINDVTISDSSNLFSMVSKDKYGVYNCDLRLDSIDTNSANITIRISKNNLPKNEFSEIPSDIIDRIIGKKESDNNSEGSNNNSGDNNNEGEINIGTTTTTPTTTDEIVYREELKKREKEKKEKNNFVSIVLYVIIGIIFFIGLLFVMYKFIIANK